MSVVEAVWQPDQVVATETKTAEEGAAAPATEAEAPADKTTAVEDAATAAATTTPENGAAAAPSGEAKTEEPK